MKLTILPTVNLVSVNTPILFHLCFLPTSHLFLVWNYLEIHNSFFSPPGATLILQNHQGSGLPWWSSAADCAPIAGCMGSTLVRELTSCLPHGVATKQRSHQSSASIHSFSLCAQHWGKRERTVLTPKRAPRGRLYMPRITGGVLGSSGPPGLCQAARQSCTREAAFKTLSPLPPPAELMKLSSHGGPDHGQHFTQPAGLKGCHSLRPQIQEVKSPEVDSSCKLGSAGSGLVFYSLG